MTKEGWLTIRNIPSPRTDSDRNTYFKLMSEYFKEHTTCPLCKGQGYRGKRPANTRPETVVRFAGIAELEAMKDAEGIQMGDVIREILETQISGRKACRVCCGARFVDRATAKSVKAKLKNKKRKA